MTVVAETAARPGHDRHPDAARSHRRRRAGGPAVAGADPELAIVLLSQHVETRHSVELVSTGGFGYLLKDRVLDVDEFLDALDRVAAGGSALDPEVVGRLIGRPATGSAALTPREREVLALMAEGCTNVGISRRLWLNERTVETHVGSIMAKLGLLLERRGAPPGARRTRLSWGALTARDGRRRCGSLFSIPGAMGSQLAAQLVAAGHEVHWVPEGAVTASVAARRGGGTDRFVVRRGGGPAPRWCCARARRRARWRSPRQVGRPASRGSTSRRIRCRPSRCGKPRLRCPATFVDAGVVGPPPTGGPVRRTWCCRVRPLSRRRISGRGRR